MPHSWASIKQVESSKGSVNFRDMRLLGRPSTPCEIGSEGLSLDAIYLKEGKIRACAVTVYVRCTQRLMASLQLQPFECVPIAPLLSEYIRR